eukprot:255387_1
MSKWLMLVGCYSRKMVHASGLGRGISVYNWDTNHGTITYTSTIPESICGPNPSALHTIHKTNHIYVCNEYNNQSGLTTLRYDPANNFEIAQASAQKSFGDDSCFLTTDKQCNFLYVANYGMNDENTSISVYSIDKSGCITPFAMDVITEPGTNAIPSRQAAAHIHAAVPCKHLSEPYEFYAADLGRDSIYHYTMNRDDRELNVKSHIRLSDGDGPRHLNYHPMMKGILYASLELGSQIAVIQYDYESNKLLNVVQKVNSLPSDVTNDAGSVYSTSHIVCDGTGRYVYCANRGHDSIVRYVVDQKSGLLDERIGGEWHPCGGEVPRHFAIDPTNNYVIVANQEGDNVTVFRIDHDQNGALQFVQSVESSSPSWIEFAKCKSLIMCKPYESRGTTSVFDRGH